MPQDTVSDGLMTDGLKSFSDKLTIYSIKQHIHPPIIHNNKAV